MWLVLVVARLALAAVFLVAALTKLRDLEGSRRAVADFGVPRRLASVLGTLLPLAELATAGALLSHFSAGWGALAACSLLLAFSIGIAVNLFLGRAPECRCFGQVHSAPVSWRMVARNLALAVGAIAIMVGQAAVVLPAVVAGAVLLLTQRRPAGLGAVAPEFDRLADLLARGKPLLLVFSDANCGACKALTPELEEWRRDYAESLTIEVVEDDELEAAYGVEGTPSAVLIGEDGRIDSAVAPGAEAIRSLVTGESGWDARLPRRAFLVRVAGAIAAMSPLLAAPVRALAAGRGTSPYPPKPCPDAVARELGGIGLCRDGCKLILQDPENCGLCDFNCPLGTICAGGKCQGPNPDEADCECKVPGSICCKGKCSNLQQNPDCGQCGRPCKGGARPTCCQGLCLDTAADPSNCGTCFNECPKDKPLCVRGNCAKTCPSGLMPCGNRCFYPKLERCCGGKLFDTAAYPTETWLCCEGKLVKSTKKCGGKLICPNLNCCKGKAVKPVNGCGPKCTQCLPPGWNIPGTACCFGKCVKLGVTTEHCRFCGDQCKPGEMCLRNGCTRPVR